MGRGIFAISVCKRGRFKEAAELQVGLYKRWVTHHGEFNRFTLVGLLNLGETRNELGEYKEAEQLYRQALHGFGTTGQPWPYLYRTMRIVGRLLCNRGALGETQVMLEEALQGQQEVHPKHDQTVSTVFVLALVYVHDNRWLKADSMCRGMDQIVRDCYGPTHYRTHAAKQIVNIFGQQTAGDIPEGGVPESLIRGLITCLNRLSGD